MGFDPVPWAVGGGAEHSPEIARQLAYVATGGAEGVVGSGDLKVAALSSPAGSVTVERGAAVIPNRFTEGTQESYTARMATQETVPIAATGAGGGRTDLIAVLITDPFVAGSTHPTPADARVGPYVEVVVVSGVSASATRLQDQVGYANETGYAIARVTLPASTTAVTNAMITDLRQFATPRSSRVIRAVSSTGTTEAGDAAPIPTGGAFALWPPQASFQVAVPSWATHAIVRGDVSAYKAIEGWVQGQVRGSFVGKTTAVSSFDMTSAAVDSYRGSVAFASEMVVDPQYQGTTQTLNFEGYRTSGTGRIVADKFTHSISDVTFEERAA